MALDREPCHHQRRGRALEATNDPFDERYPKMPMDLPDNSYMHRIPSEMGTQTDLRRHMES